MQFTDTKLKAGTKYTYKVRAYTTYKQKQWYNKKSKKWVTKKPKKKYRGKKRKVTVKVYGPYSAAKLGRTKAKTATPAPSPAPAAEPLVITGLKADMGYISGQVSWNSAPEATQYRVSVNGTIQGVTKSCSYALVNLQPRTSYTVTVVAENGSAAGKATEGTYTTSGVPAPANISVSSTQTSITIKWNAVDGAEYYVIDRTDGSYATPTSTSYTETGLSPNTQYTFYLRARVSGKYSLKQDGKITATTGVQAPGSIKPSQIMSKTAILSWSAVSGANSYRILDSDKNIVDTILCT